LKSYLENKQKTEIGNRNGNWQSLCAQVSRKTEVLTAVSRNCWFTLVCTCFFPNFVFS